ncbi:efflux transporter outer membrane subunit [Thalassospira profundimaris]|uniref:efflux transporter outer membrane subunit n=1 Tax=Thalassospira profundimaris TaxID=502049 RepID=UPI000DEDA699|nr:TolC family protein [Thalassospira profundimaris]
MKNILKTGTILSILVLAGCSSLTEVTYNRPDMLMPDQWNVADVAATNTNEGIHPDAATRTDILAQTGWWKNFDDTQLNELIAKALETNNDLAAATIKVRQAQLTAGLAEDALYPNLSTEGDASTSRQFDSEDNRSNGDITRNYGLDAGISYELDLWGKLGHDYDAAKWEALATIEDRESTALSLIGTTATLYWQAVYYQQRLDIAQASIDYAQQTFDLVDVQYASGSTSSLEVNEARSNLESQRAAYSVIEQNLTETKNALSILFNQPPSDIQITRKTLPAGILPSIPEGLPSELLERRPDVRAAEMRLRESVEELNSVKTSLLPTISLTGTLGSSSDQLQNLLSNPIGTLGASLALPFLNWNEGQLNINVSEAEYEQAITEFRQTTYQAMADVENALSARTNYDRRAERLEAALEASRNAESIYETRFRAGAVGMQDWLDAQENRRTTEETLLENQLDRITNLITLYQALGGDTTTIPEPSDPSTSA